MLLHIHTQVLFLLRIGLVPGLPNSQRWQLLVYLPTSGTVYLPGGYHT